jgi:BirA family biotin operon repressor/biotin-[acetyl-CoA-carboxylase] ligase
MTAERILRERVVREIANYNLQDIDVFAYSVTDSTNARAVDCARHTSPERVTVFVADSQSAGRGRRGRAFDSPSGSGLYFSVLIPVQDSLFDFTELTVRGAVATRRAILEVAGIDTEIKWVNDILLDGRKTAGILAEAVTDRDSGRVEHSVLGIGINTERREFPEELRDVAVSLESYTDRAVDRSKLLAVILRELFSPRDFPSVLEEYRRHSATLGKRVLVTELSGVSYGAEAIGICDTGALRVTLDSGEMRELISAEVSVKINDKQ